MKMQKIILIVSAPLHNTCKGKEHVTWKEKSIRGKGGAIFKRENTTRAIGKVKNLLLLKEESSHQLKSLDIRGIIRLNSNYIFLLNIPLSFTSFCDLYTQLIASLA
jgi:hypothetical protein